MNGGWVERRTADGSSTLAHPVHGETLHSVAGAWTQARERYARECRLRERALELRAEGRATLFLCDVGTGLGLNLALPDEARVAIEAPGALTPTDLASAFPDGLPSRNQVAALLVAALQESLARFAVRGFASLAADWESLDALRDAPVQIQQAGEQLQGTARGTDRDGALLVETSGRLVRVFSGDVSVRGRTP